MASVPKPKSTASSAPETVEHRFRRLESIWEAETGFLSSTSEIIGHPAFREIVGMGNAVIPLMLHDLEVRPRLWVWALAEITNENPVASEDAGNIAKMSNAWRRWGRETGY
jgi:hypothetical protein